ncbi:hypothetical protein VitviT2T_014274 [Vitis vinifera]|uniref:CCHC-type domain-containing protein n=1 Tax=Vitis vinifera TaxID=29760 RepID=A0ABY9CK55_VITVI|nr:hypothetical protein VitviT2T_014274 [Vitis vinifera]
MEELIGSLMTYDINLEKKLQEGEDKKKKNIALKATTKEEENVEEEKPSEKDDDLALITRKLNKYMRGERFRGRKFTFRRDISKKESSSHGDKDKWEEKRDLMCFKCKKSEHIKYDCPLYKSEAKRRMKKAMMATWSESEESSEEEKEKEVANICFMAIDELDEAKAWPTIPGFEPREAIQRLCGLADAHGMGKPSAHSLTVPSRVLHHMICSILLPRGGHRDEVSYYEAFLVDSLLTGRRIHVGYVMMRHMMSCCESTTRVLPYGRFLTRVFKDAGVDLSRETEFEAPSIYDTYDEHSLGRMKLEKAPDGSWVRKAERQARGYDQLHPGVEEEDEIREMEDGLDPQRDLEQRGSELDIPAPHQSGGIHDEATFSEPMMTEPSFTELPSQAPHAPEHPPWMDLSAQISSLETRMEELAVVHDTRFYSVEDCIDQYQAGFTSQFEQLAQRIERLESRQERLESRQESQHEEMMAYLRSVFPPSPPQP